MDQTNKEIKGEISTCKGETKEEWGLSFQIFFMDNVLVWNMSSINTQKAF